METEEEQVEELKRWWQENGRSLIVGLVLGLGGVFGWTSWKTHVEDQAALASLRYEQIINDAAAGNHSRVRTQTEAFIEEFPDSGYATLSALLAARSALAEKDFAGATAQLTWVIEHADAPELKDIARLRRARVQLGQDQIEQALREIDQIDAPSLASQIAELRGDALVVKGDETAARTAYEAALGSADISPATRQRVQMKVDELGMLNYAPGAEPKAPLAAPRA